MKLKLYQYCIKEEEHHILCIHSSMQSYASWSRNLGLYCDKVYLYTYGFYVQSLSGRIHSIKSNPPSIESVRLQERGYGNIALSHAGGSRK